MRLRWASRSTAMSEQAGKRCGPLEWRSTVVAPAPSLAVRGGRPWGRGLGEAVWGGSSIRWSRRAWIWPLMTRLGMVPFRIPRVISSPLHYRQGSVRAEEVAVTREKLLLHMGTGLCLALAFGCGALPTSTPTPTPIQPTVAPIPPTPTAEVALQ